MELLKTNSPTLLGLMIQRIRIMGQRIRHVVAPLGVANFSGSIWDRMRGLESLFDKCDGSSVLDVACCEGLISYEFARHGAAVIHGVERDRDRVRFANRLFRDVPVESRFESTDLARQKLRWLDSFESQYDIVLFLGIYQHLSRQMNQEELLKLVVALCRRCQRFFAVRTGKYPEFEHVILAEGFDVVHTDMPKERKTGAPLRIYERRAES